MTDNKIKIPKFYMTKFNKTKVLISWLGSKTYPVFNGDLAEQYSNFGTFTKSLISLGEAGAGWEVVNRDEIK